MKGLKSGGAECGIKEYTHVMVKAGSETGTGGHEVINEPPMTG